jgi:radical SAM-linked protein
MQRLRVKFSRGDEIKFISHLDLMRLWQRALRRAGMPLAYSEGFNPHPRISLAAPLPLGVTGEAELMDIVLSRPVSPHFFTDGVNQQLPPGIQVMQARLAAPALPSLQSQVRFAEYRVELASGKEQAEIQSAIGYLLSLEHLPWQHQRDTGPRHYDLRALIEDLWLIGCQDAICTLGMRLRCDSGGSGRPEQVAAALGFPGYPKSIHRTRLILQAE